jgi:hypothetical protein
MSKNVCDKCSKTEQTSISTPGILELELRALKKKGQDKQSKIKLLVWCIKY